jgi:chemotaxis signal transduction protein
MDPACAAGDAVLAAEDGASAGDVALPDLLAQLIGNLEDPEAIPEAEAERAVSSAQVEAEAAAAGEPLTGPPPLPVDEEVLDPDGMLETLLDNLPALDERPEPPPGEGPIIEITPVSVEETRFAPQPVVDEPEVPPMEASVSPERDPAAEPAMAGLEESLVSEPLPPLTAEPFDSSDDEILLANLAAILDRPEAPEPAPVATAQPEELPPSVEPEPAPAPPPEPPPWPQLNDVTSDFQQLLVALQEPLSGEAPPAPPSQPVETRRYLALGILGKTYGLPMDEVLETSRLPVLTRVPGVPAHVRGVANWRGDLLPLLDLRVWLGQLAAPLRGRLVVVRTPEEGSAAGLIVDELAGLFSAEAGQPLEFREQAVERLALSDLLRSTGWRATRTETGAGASR